MLSYPDTPVLIGRVLFILINISIICGDPVRFSQITNSYIALAHTATSHHTAKFFLNVEKGFASCKLLVIVSNEIKINKFQSKTSDDTTKTRRQDGDLMM